MNNYTDTQLKQALAQMLPDVIDASEQRYNHIVWKKETYQPVLDTELLHLCHLVEEQMTMGQLCAMSNELSIMHQLEGSPCDASQWQHHKSWQERAIALCKVKGIKI